MNKSFVSRSFILSSSDLKNYLILFIFWPFLAFLLALMNYSQKMSRKVVYIFLIYYGLTFVIGELGGNGPDAKGYAMILMRNAQLPFTDFFKIIVGLYASDTSVDIIEPFISFLVSRFTENYKILFAVYASVFGYFYLKSIGLLYNRYAENQGYNSLLLLTFFIFILPITSINGIRMWTAAWIFFYGAYHVILYRDKRFLLLSLGSCLMHWSFFSANFVLIIYFIAGNRNFIYLPIAVVSFIFPKLIAPFFHLMSSALGGSFQSRYNSYSNEAYIIVRQEEFEQSAWFLRIGYDMVLYYLLLAIIVIQFKSGKLMSEKPEKNLFSFLIIFLAFVNFGKGIPSFGGRFQIVFFLFATLYVFLYLVKQPGNKVNLLTLIGLFPMLLYTAIVFRQGADSINAWLFTPGFGLPLFVPDVSLTNLLFD